MSKAPQSFVMLLQRRYRVYFNAQGGTWYAAYVDDGERERVSLGARTRPEAEDAVRQLDAKVATAVSSAPIIEPTVPKVEEAAVSVRKVLWADIETGFLQHKKLTGRTKRTLTRAGSSLAAFGRYLESKGIKEAAAITLPLLEGYFSYRTEVEDADPISAYTDQIVLKGAMKWAARPSRALLPANPALDWETPKPLKPKKRTYTLAEVEALEAGVREWLRPILTTLAWTGLRIGELVNLRWKDVDLEQRVIHIRIQEGWNPKGKRDRTVPLHPKVEAVLKKQRVGEYVFSGPKGGRMKPDYCLHCLKYDQRRLKLAKNDLHGFRRFFATTMMKAGVSAETVRQWGGWKTLDTMLRYLADIDVKDSVKAMDQAAKRLEAS